MNTPDTELRFKITGMDCASCAKSIEKGVAALPKVEEATINFTTATLRVAGAADRGRIVARVRELGYDVAPGEGEKGRKGEGEIVTDGTPSTLHPLSPAQKSSGLLSYLWNRSDTRLALLAALLVIPGILFDELLPGLGIESPVFAAMSVLAMIIAGYPIARSALTNLRVNREITINLLMTIAAVGAVIIGAYTEAGLVMVLFALSEGLEGYTANRARDAIGSLSELCLLYTSPSPRD